MSKRHGQLSGKALAESFKNKGKAVLNVRLKPGTKTKWGQVTGHKL